MAEDKRYVFLVEMTVGRPYSSSELEEALKKSLPIGVDPVVWGVISGVDAAYRKLRQLSAETERDASKGDRIHSAHKAMSFFRDMFPPAFWKWKLIGGEPLRDPETGKIQRVPGRSS